MKKEELKNYQINEEDLTYPNGEMNIIVQGFNTKSDDENDNIVYPDIYHPRKSFIWSCTCEGDGYDLSDKEERDNYIAHLKDSAGRLRILAVLLEKQAKELAEKGYIETDCYYPDLENILD